MAHNYMQQANGLAPNGQPNQRQLRVPTVNEALPYSPFSSIVPFNPDLITAPMALPSIEPTAFEDLEDIKAARRDLERLEAGSRSSEAEDKRKDKAANDVKRLLEPSNLPEYKFKTSKRTRADLPPSKTQPQLSSFAGRVYEENNVTFSYATPEASPTSDDNIVVKHKRPSDVGDNIVVSPRRVQQPPGQQTMKKIVVKHPDMSEPRHSGHSITPRPDALPQAGLQNGNLNAHHTAPTPSKSTPKALVLPAPLTPAQRAEYKMGRDSTPLRNQAAYLTSGRRAVSLDQKADQAVDSMQSLLVDIFEAEDQLQPDTSGFVSAQGNIFSSTEVEDGSSPLFTADTLLRLDAAATKVYAHNRIDSFEVEQLARVQKLCEAFLASSESGLLHVGEDWEEQDISNWLSRVASAHHGLIAARVMMRIMAGGSRYKELQSEDHLRLVLDTVRTAVEGCVIPVIEMRSIMGDKVRGEKAAPRNPAFDIAVENRKTLQLFMKLTTKCTQLLGELFYKTDVDESGISSLEYLCKTLIFAENATSDRDAALGTQSFENLRKAAMDGLARIFEKYTSQRTFIVDEMLLSLDKLPATKQSARQYTLPDAKPIQLVSALLMRLVQTSATADLRGKTTTEEDDEDEEDEESAEDESDDSEEYSSAKKKSRKQRSAAPKSSKDLSSLYEPLKKSAEQYARYIVRVLLERALGTSKSSDEPYRRLLDIFVDDFLNVMGSTDWPAAELLLRALVTSLVGLAENPKSPAPSRTLALEILGTVGSGILDIRASALSGANALDTDDPLSARLANVVRAMKNGDMSTATLTAFEGPYRVVIEYLDARDSGNDPRLQSARGYHLMQWADFVCSDRENSPDAISVGYSATALQTRIRYMIEDEHWLGNAEPDFPRPTTDQGKLAGRLVAANSLLCKAFSRIFSVVLKSLSSEQPTVRSRSLKSVNTLLEKDPSVLDRDTHVLNHIVRCLGDASALVRDSALGLLQKCVNLRPAVEQKVYKQIVPRTNDTAVGVRKRAMAFLKDVYLHSDDNLVRAQISNALISRMQDNEESVAEVARATIEEVWFSAFRDIASSDRSVDAQLRLNSHTALIIQTVELGDDVANVLEKMLKKLLSSSKQASDNVRIAKMFVAVTVERLREGNLPGGASQATVAGALYVFAKAWPKLFTPTQLSHLEPFTRHLNTTADLEMFVPVVNILNYTLPVVIGVNDKDLEKLTTSLLTGMGKTLPKSVVAVIAPCVATMDALLGHTKRPLLMIKSALAPIHDERKSQVSTEPPAKQVKRLLILGQFGKSCDLDRHLAEFKSDRRYSSYRGDNVAGLLLEIICYFTSPTQPVTIREAAIGAICEICQSYPEHFERADVVNAIEAVFQARVQSLESAMLTSLEAFFATGVAGGEQQEEIAAGIEGGAQRLGGTYKATGHDKASAALSQRFMPQFLRIALSSVSDVALTAARIVVLINTSGLSYPQDSAPGLVALETCPNSAIAGLAFQAHKEQFGKYESIFEKQLVKAVQRAFQYQVQVVQSATGCSGSPPAAKLHFFWDVTKTGKAGVRQKFATNICASMNFDPAKLQLKGSMSPHLMYVRFCVENIAFFDYTSVSEVSHLLSSLEKTVAGTGTEVAQAIESDVQKIQVPVTSSATAESGSDGIVVASTEPAPMLQNNNIDPQRLEQLTVSAQILSLIWETRTYLRKLWMMQKYAGKPKNLAKDGSKAPTRATNAPALTESFQRNIKNIMASLDTETAKKAMCTSFVETYTVDSEVKVGSGDEDNMEIDDEDDARSVSSTSKSPSVAATPRGKKRKSIDSGMNGGPKKRGRPRKSSMSKKNDFDDEGGWD
ncbi:hypothetical protein M409DRAFT_67560 [Zasmidium cellare ATCC 36951]|uniref:Sister chromatid cohesion protein n=1 Tax=Zasmidium cellare ATCC 36951 TaxID=1080233 RepID=A0A6A6CCA2_ZASCE|nr:uncharacterized protein M409DRAFT_67560 [Zasmidium cellare ATCC 36951]KAF2164827.1 hypothetical protein M409DRAFT_67560 [Zasmidium cellare ATCC 36951]